MQCPKCGFEQKNKRPICDACGLVFAKYQQAEEKRVDRSFMSHKRRKTYKRNRRFLTWPFRVLFYTSGLLLTVGFFQQNKFSNDLQIKKSLLHEPIQKQTRQRPFSVSQKDVNYKITPLFDYEISGLIVSYRHHDGRYDIQNRLWNDHINVSDLCVVWSDNAATLDLNQFTFWNGSFTCNIETGNREAWQKFKLNQLSNNHLVTADDAMRNKIAQARIGDQIHIKGLLSNYSSGNGTRGTSTTRDDTGNGACETIYVKEFTIIKSMENIWRSVVIFAGIGLLISFVSGFVGLFRD